MSKRTHWWLIVDKDYGILCLSMHMTRAKARAELKRLGIPGDNFEIIPVVRAK